MVTNANIENEWETSEINISDIESLLDDHYIEIDSVDGWVPVTSFVDKGNWDEYLLTMVDGREVKVNKNHLFQTINGWESAKELCWKYKEYLTDCGVMSGLIVKTGREIPIVDIQVNHPNHRYYTNGISSHNTNVGKSLFLCHAAAAAIRSGINVLYITLEMSEERIAERVDCNLMDVALDDLYKMKHDDFSSKINVLKSKTHGKLVIKEYPTGGAHVGHFKALLDELKMKKRFVPDVIFIDYMNICASQKYSGGNNWNSYTAIKSIAEELRGMAIEYNVPIHTASQLNRNGNSNSDADLTDVSESFGTVMTADFVFAIIRSEELDQLGQLMIKQLKSRYNDVNFFKRFIIGIDINKFKLYNVDSEGQRGIADAGTSIESHVRNKAFAASQIDVNELDFD